MHGWLCDTRDGYPNQYMIRNLADTPSSCNKISVVQEPAYMSFVRDTLKNHPIYDQYEYVFSDKRKMEITNKNITKGNALDLIMEKQNFQQDEVVVFGDSENDISMFKNKKYSVAMGNALNYAKQQANYTTDSHNHEGIYNMLVHLENQGLFE